MSFLRCNRCGLETAPTQQVTVCGRCGGISWRLIAPALGVTDTPHAPPTAAGDHAR